MPEEQTGSPENPQALIDSFVRPIWYHELLTDDTRKYRELTSESLKFVLSDNQISLDSVIAIPTGGSRWALTGEDPVHYQFLFLDQAPDLDDLDASFRAQYVVPRDWMSIDDALAHLDESNALKALMLTPDEFVVGNLERARELRLEALKLGGKNWWRSVEEYVEKKVNTWGKRKHENDTGKRRFEAALHRMLSSQNDPEEWRAGFLERLKSRRTPSFVDYSTALESLGGAISCPENRNPAPAAV